MSVQTPAELARPRPLLKAHQADIPQHHTHPTDTERLQRGWAISTHPPPQPRREAPSPQMEGTCLPNTSQRVLPSPAMLGCQYSQGLDILRHQRGILRVSLWEDQVPSLSQAVTPNGLEEKAGGRTQLLLPPS